MGYSTDFTGQLDLNKKLKPQHKAYLLKFSETRRVTRNENKAATLADPIRKKVKLPVGKDGEFFVGGVGFMGQDDDVSVIDHNSPPSTQPSLWNQWVPNEDGTAIVWDGGEKFYNYVEWLSYIIYNFIKPWKYVLNGEIFWQGEESSDMGKIVVENNEITVLNAKITYEEN